MSDEQLDFNVRYKQFSRAPQLTRHVLAHVYITDRLTRRPFRKCDNHIRSAEVGYDHLVKVHALNKAQKDPFEDIIDAFSDRKKARNGGSEGKAECMPTAYRNHSRHQYGAIHLRLI